MKKVLAIILALLMLTALVSCSGKQDNASDDDTAGSTVAEAGFKLQGKDVSTEPVKIAYIPVSTTGATTEIAQQAADDVMLKYDNVDIQFFDAGYDPTTQISLVSECIAQKFDVLVMECTDEVAINSVIEEAEQAGIVVVTTNQNCSCIHSAYLNNNSYDAGWLVGETLVKDMGETGKVVLLDCPASMTMSTLHGTGFQDYISQYPGIELVDYANIDGFSQENAATAMRDILTKHDEIDAVYGMSDDIAIGAIQAIESAGRTGDGILVYGSECMPNAVEALRNGTLKATVWGDRYTMLYMAFNIGLLYVDAGINSVILGFEDTPWISTPFKAVTQENVERMIPFLRYSSLQG